MIDRRFVPLLMSRSVIEGQHLLVIASFRYHSLHSLRLFAMLIDSLVDYRRQSTFFGISSVPPNASALHLAAVLRYTAVDCGRFGCLQRSTLVSVCKFWLVDCERRLHVSFPFSKSGAEHPRSSVLALSLVSGFSRVNAESLTRARPLYHPFFTSQNSSSPANPTCKLTRASPISTPSQRLPNP